MKTKEELNALKEEVETVNKKLHELTDEELAQVAGGSLPGYDELGIVMSRAVCGRTAIFGSTLVSTPLK